MREVLIKMTPEVRDALSRQMEAFKQYFGRAPVGDEPVFFCMHVDYPRMMTECFECREEIAALRKRTGLW